MRRISEFCVSLCQIAQGIRGQDDLSDFSSQLTHQTIFLILGHRVQVLAIWRTGNQTLHPVVSSEPSGGGITGTLRTYTSCIGHLNLADSILPPPPSSRSTVARKHKYTLSQGVLGPLVSELLLDDLWWTGMPQPAPVNTCHTRCHKKNRHFVK